MPTTANNDHAPWLPAAVRAYCARCEGQTLQAAVRTRASEYRKCLACGQWWYADQCVQQAAPDGAAGPADDKPGHMPGAEGAGDTSGTRDAARGAGVGVE